MDQQSTSKIDELEALRAKLESLESELSADKLPPQTTFSRDYADYYAMAGLVLGVVGAAASLLFNVIGAQAAGINPLQLIRVYLTFPLGEQALRLAEGGVAGAYALNDGLIIALGCCLYLATGMVLGVLVTVGISKLAPKAGFFLRLIVAGLISLAIWGVNFYGILSWLQPMLFGGDWIVDNSLLPWWVAAATHAVFGWTIALLYPFAGAGARPTVENPS